MNIKEEIKKHEEAIKILQLIELCQTYINSNEEMIAGFAGHISHVRQMYMNEIFHYNNVISRLIDRYNNLK